MPAPVLHLGNKNYSSWSMRPWLALKWGGIAFDEHVIPLGGPGYGDNKIREVLAVSPSGKVPALHLGDTIIYESLAICEWAAEQTPSLWPADALMRAEARAVACEMHGGFGALRNNLPMNIRRRLEREPNWGADVRAELERVFKLWGGLRACFGGPFLFGERSIADAMFAPICTRLRTYKVSAPDDALAYCATIFADAAFQQWEQAGVAETWTLDVWEAYHR